MGDREYNGICLCDDPCCPDSQVAPYYRMKRRQALQRDETPVDVVDDREADARADGWWGERMAMMERRVG